MNRLCTCFYDITPLEFAEKQVNPDHIKHLEINRTWYLSQINNKCVSKDTVQLLSALSYEELVDFMKNKNFVKNLYREIMRLGLAEKSRDIPLIKASVHCLLLDAEQITNQVPEPHQVCVF